LLTQTTTTAYLNITATANPDQILTVPETFSTDTAGLVYAGSGTYTLSTLANAPVGTFITFTYAINSNTRTQTTTAPTQTTSDMNANGLLIYTRAYNAASTAAQPTAYAIQIGKGMKGHNINLYGSAGKVLTGSTDFYALSTAQQVGIMQKNYNEVTGILYIDAGQNSTNTITSAIYRMEDGTTPTSGYLVINASKNPALTGIGLSRTGARYTSNAGQAIGTSSTLLTYEDIDYDTNGAYVAGVYTVPETGYYDIKASFLTATQTLGTGQRILIDIYVNGVSKSTASTMGTGAGNNPYVAIEETLYLTKGQTVSIYGISNVATTMNTGSNFNKFAIFKVSV
jgi:hypothetical protein